MTLVRASHTGSPCWQIKAYLVDRTMTQEPRSETGANNPERATSMSRLMAFSQNSSFLERFWREFKISFWSHKPLCKTKRLLTTFSFHLSYLILLIIRSWTGRSFYVRGKKIFKMYLKITKLSTEAHLPTSRYGQYLTYAHKLVRDGKRRDMGLVKELLSWVMGSWAGINKWHLSLFKHILFCFILLFTSSSPCRKDQFAACSRFRDSLFRSFEKARTWKKKKPKTGGNCPRFLFLSSSPTNFSRAFHFRVFPLSESLEQATVTVKPLLSDSSVKQTHPY